MENTFLPLIFRMKHIHRWGLMHNTQQENLMKHTIECAFITNYLAIIGNRYFSKNHDVNKLTTCALFHDITEVLTGDLPTKTNLTDEERKLLKIADKLCAHIKCIHELNAGNKEFHSPYCRIQREMSATESEELHYFLDNCLAAFSLSLYDLKGTLD